MPHLRESPRPCVVMMTSLAGVRPTGSSIAYAMTKAALNHLTLLLAKSCGPVRVNAVAPGLVATPWTADWGPVHDLFGEKAPLGRSGEADDVAEVIVDIAASAYVTGQVIVVDGGVTLA
jgi:ketoreductase RED2